MEDEIIMNVKAAEYIRNQGYPALVLRVEVEINDRKKKKELEALIADFKKGLLDEGFVHLGSREVGVDWDEILPKKRIDKDLGYGEELIGFTNDPVVVQLARDYYKAVNKEDGKVFKEGSVPIPGK